MPAHLPLIVGSVTDKLVDFCTNVIGDLGYAGVFVLMLLESACVPIPSEATMLFAGFKVDDGTLTLFGVVAAGVLGNLLGSWIGWAAGYYGRTELLEKNRLIHVSPESLASMDRWFERHGDAAVSWTRLLPVVRALVSLPAGMAEMPLWRFTWLTALGSLPWIVGFTLLGDAVGNKWDEWRDHLQYLDYAAVVLILAAIVVLLVRRRRGGGPRGEQPEPTPARAGGR